MSGRLDPSFNQRTGHATVQGTGDHINFLVTATMPAAPTATHHRRHGQPIAKAVFLYASLSRPPSLILRVVFPGILLSSLFSFLRHADATQRNE